jgi:hypothetical protein
MRPTIAVLFTLLTFFAATPIRSAEAASQAGVTTDFANVRVSPSSQSTSVDVLTPGDIFPVVGTVAGEQVSGGNGVWLQTAGGHYVYSGVAKLQQSDSTYIDVNRRTHTALAIANGAIVHSARVVVGQPGWRTPLGQFTIIDRVAAQTMDSTVLGIPINSPLGFSYPNVRYVQYLSGGFAIHWNYWAPATAFGLADSSHGCIGMQLDDAKFFWNFANVGTSVFIHD